jgi:hypothetical protein
VTQKGTLSGAYGASVTLTSAAYANPVTVTGSITAATGSALLAGTAWTIVNRGSIAGNHAGGSGISLAAGGSIDNADGATIGGGKFFSIYVTGAAGTVTDGGKITNGMVLDAGGSVSIGSTGTDTGHGVYIYGGAGTVVNAGRISVNNPAAFGIGVRIGGSAGGNITNQVGATLYGYDDGVDITGGTGNVINDGHIAGGTGNGVILEAGGTVAVGAGASVSGAGGFGVAFYGQAGTLTNGGTISGYGGVVLGADGTVANAGTIVSNGGDFLGVELRRGGTLTNQHGASISGGSGVVGGASPVTVINQGHITGSANAGVRLSAGGTLSNAAGGVILGTGTATAVLVGRADGTVINAGSIGSAGTADAVQFSLGYKNRLVVDPSARFTGLLDGGNTIGNEYVSVLELRSGTGALGGFTNFGSIVFDAGAAWTVSGAPGALAGGELISGFAPGDTIELVGVTAAKSGLVGDTLELTGGLDLILPGNSYSLAQFHVSEAGGNTDVSVACYLRGTRILTARGEVAVEALCVGDRVPTLGGRLAPIVWIGRRRYAGARRDAVRPVLIRAGALADGVPARSLHLSPEHSLWFDGALVPARHLTNGKNIVRCDGPAVLEYFHVELAEHAIVFAEGAAAETFADCDTRALFDNAASYAGGGSPRWTGCAPRLDEGARLAEIRERIDARAGIAHGDAIGPLVGRLERVTDARVEGWAQDARAPERPVWLEIIADGAPAAFVLANGHREDLAAAGLGSGRHAFRVALARQPGRVEARRVEDGALLGALVAANAARLPVSR